MLQKIREKIQGWVATLLLVLLTAGFLVWGIEYYLTQAGGDEKEAASVNGTKISERQLDNTYQQLQRRQQQTSQGAPISDEQRQQLKHMALQRLIISTALVNAAKKAGFSVSEDQLKQLIVNAPQFQVNGQFSPEKFQQMVYANSTSMPEFFKMLQSTVITDQVASGIQQSAFVLLNEVKRAYELLKEKRTFGYLLIPSSNFKSAVKIPEEQIQAFYNEHKSDFITPEKISVSYIILSPEELMKNVQVSAEEIKSYYLAHQKEYTQHGQVKPLHQLQDNIKAIIQQQKIEPLFTKKSEDLTNLSFTNPMSLEAAAKATGLKINQSDLMTREGEKSGLFADPKVLAAAFSDEVLQQKNNSNPIELKDGSIMILRVNEHQASKPQELSEVRQQILEKLQLQAAQRQAGLVAYQVINAINAGKDPVAVANQHHLQWHVEKEVDRTNKVIPIEVRTAAFELSPLAKTIEGRTATTTTSKGDYAVIKLEQVHPGNFKNATAEEIKALTSNLSTYQGELDYRFYVTSVLKNSKVEIKHASKDQGAS